MFYIGFQWPNIFFVGFGSVFEIFRYEGEWLQNDMEGHGVVEVDIPDIEPMPGSKYDSHSY